MTAAAPEREPLDLRLAMGAVAGWLAVLACGQASALRCVTVAVVAAVLALGLLALAGRRSFAAAGALALFCMTLVLVPLAGRIAHARASPLFQLARAHARISVVLTVTADPRILAAKGVAGAARVAVETAAGSLTYAGRAADVDGTVLVLADAGPWRDVLPGQRVGVRRPAARPRRGAVGHAVHPRAAPTSRHAAVVAARRRTHQIRAARRGHRAARAGTRTPAGARRR